jgi:Signal transduction histidine kinase
MTEFYVGIGILSAAVVVLIIFLIRKALEASAYKAVLDAVKKQLTEAGGGKFVRRKGSTPYGDINAFADYVNSLSEEISENINSLNSEKNTLNAVLSGMGQGILALDGERT